MAGDRLLDLLSLGVLAGVALVGLVRTVALAARGRWALPIDRERSRPEALADLAFLLGLLAWLYESVATALGLAWRLVPGALQALQVPWTGLRWLGIALAVAGLALHARALHDLGASWRFTIDRERPGELITAGVFARTRNPVYVALSAVGLGVSLALGSPVLVAAACVAPLYFHHLVRREERFLAARHGEPYARYRARVPRWLVRGRAG